MRRGVSGGDAMPPALELGEVELQRVADAYHQGPGRIERRDRMPGSRELTFKPPGRSTAEERHETKVAMRWKDDAGWVLLHEVPTATEHVSSVACIGGEGGVEMCVEPFEAVHGDRFES